MPALVVLQVLARDYPFRVAPGILHMKIGDFTLAT
jgi:hypothetical protein